MVSLATVEEQLKNVGCNFRFWGRAELKELCQILLPGEKIAQVVNGQYEAGFAMLCATDFRVLLIDKKPKYLTLKDIRFDMITELDFSNRMMNSTVRIYTPNKELRFTTPSAKRLRKLFTHVQHKVMEIRHHFTMMQFQQQHDMQNTPPGIAMANYYNQALAQGQAGFLPGSGYNQPSQQSGFMAQQFEPQFEPIQQPVQLSASTASTMKKMIDPRRVAAAMGAAGLKNFTAQGEVVDTLTMPLAQQWHKRPYGFSRDSLPTQQA